MEKGVFKVEIKNIKEDDSPMKKLEIAEDEETLKKKEEYLKSGIDLEKINKKAESAKNIEERDVILGGAERIEKALDVLEEELGELGVDGIKVLEAYQELSKKGEQEVAEIVSEDAVEEIVSGLIRRDGNVVEKIKNSKFSLDKLARIFACFLFLTIGAVPSSASDIEIAGVGIESSQELKKSDIEKFLNKLDVVKIFHDQEYLDMKIPVKPKDHEDENWQIQIFEDGTTVGNFDVGMKAFFGAFGRNRNVKIDKVELVIEKDGEFKRYEIDILGKKEVKKDSAKHQETVGFKYENFLEKVDARKDSREKFSLILEELESPENSVDLKEKIKDCFKKEISDYAENFRKLDDENIKFAKDLFAEVFIDVSFSGSVGEEITDFIFEKEMFLEEEAYKRETKGLSGEEKLWKVSQNPFYYIDILHRDPELVKVLKKRVGKMNEMTDSEELKNALSEVKDFFEGTNFWKGSELDSLQKDYEELKKG